MTLQANMSFVMPSLVLECISFKMSVNIHVLKQPEERPLLGQKRYKFA